jgi:hypothetical protein
LTDWKQKKRSKTQFGRLFENLKLKIKNGKKVTKVPLTKFCVIFSQRSVPGTNFKKAPGKIFSLKRRWVAASDLGEMGN